MKQQKRKKKAQNATSKGGKKPGMRNEITIFPPKFNFSSIVDSVIKY